MKVKINQLEEKVNENNADLIIQELKKEKDQLRQIVNKYRESKNADKVSDDDNPDIKTKQVGIQVGIIFL